MMKRGMIYGVLAVAIVVAVVSAILLVTLYPKGMVTGDVTIESATNFAFSVPSTSFVLISTYIPLMGTMNVYPLYASSSLAEMRYVHVGKSSNELLVTSDNESLIIDNVASQKFVVSGGFGGIGRSYILIVSNIRSDSLSNLTTIRNYVNGVQICVDKRAGDNCSVESLNLTIERVDKSNSVERVVLRAPSNVHFNRFYDMNGNYVVLPLERELPTANYNFSVYSGAGMMIQKYSAYIDSSGFKTGPKIDPVCYDPDGLNYTSQGFASKGATYRNDNCTSIEMLNEAACDATGTVIYLSFNCSSINSNCINGACARVIPPCVPNWTALNTSCQNDYIITFYNDSNSCGSPAGRPQNLSLYCGRVMNGLIGTEDDITDRRVSVSVDINNKRINYSMNYSGATRGVLFKDRDNNASLINFNWDFSKPLDLTSISVERQDSILSSNGYVVTTGIENSKTVYVDKLNINSYAVCIRDSNTSSISSVSQWCNASGEILLSCPGTNGSYSCDINVDGDKFIVSGLTHSVVKEFVDPSLNLSGEECIADWQCTNYGGCVEGMRFRICSDINYCGTIEGRPNMSEVCYQATNLTSVPTSCIPNWQCDAWSPAECPKDTQTQARTCSDKNNCGVLTGKPIESKSCVAKTTGAIYYVLIIVLSLAILVIIGIIAYILLGKKPQATETNISPAVAAAPTQPGQRPF